MCMVALLLCTSCAVQFEPEDKIAHFLITTVTLVHVCV